MQQSWRHAQMQHHYDALQQQRAPASQHSDEHLAPPPAAHPSILAHQPSHDAAHGGALRDDMRTGSFGEADQVDLGGAMGDEEANDNVLASQGEPIDLALGVPPLGAARTAAPAVPLGLPAPYQGYVPKQRNTMPLGNTNLVFGNDRGAMAKHNFARNGSFSAQESHFH